MISANLLAVDEEKIQPNAMINGDGFGGATCLKGDMLIVGAPFKDVAGTDSVGAVQYFKRIAGTWIYQGEIVSPTVAVQEFFGTSVDFNGTHLVIGAPFNDDNGLNAGAIYIYEWDGSNFNFVKQNLASSGAAGDEYGRTVSIYDSTIVVGSPKDDGLVPDGGAVYLYHFDSNNWTESQKILSNFPEFGNEFFGYSVDMHKDRFIVGSTLDDDAATDAGTAFIYHFDGTTWNFEQKISPSDGGSSHSFGFSTCINDSILIVGAFGANNSVPSSGAAYIFRRSGTVWTEEEILFQDDVDIDDWFGFDVEVEGNTAIVSALNNDEFVLNGGSVYLIRYDEVNAEWVTEYNQFANDGLLNWRYGYSVSLDGLNYVVGALQATGTTVKSGAVYYYDICTHTIDQTICAVSCDSTDQGNYIQWNDVKTTLIDSFYLFKSIAGMNNYLPVGSRDYYDNSSLFDATDVWQTPYSYKISTKNICGVESDSSSQHTSIFLTSKDTAGTVVLDWTPAEGYNFDYYRVFRDPEGDGTYNLMFAVVSSTTTFTDYTPTGLLTTQYRVLALATNPCTNLDHPVFSSTYSNSSIPSFTSIEENELLDFSIYPNPTKNILNIESGFTPNSEYEVVNSLGEIMQKGLLGNGRITLANLEKGFYFIRVSDGVKIGMKKFVLE